MKTSMLHIFSALLISFQVVSAISLPPVGAVYFLTNEATGNYIVSADIDVDGKLSFADVVYAGGVGAHDLPIQGGVNGSDPFSTQNGIKKSSAGNLLATVNAGSDTVVLFAIDPQIPSKIRMIGSPVPSGGEFPVSVAINKSGTQVCVLNGGAINGVKCFSVDQKLGLIDHGAPFLPLGLNLTTPPVVLDGAVSDIIYSEDGTKLIVSTKAKLPAAGFLATWDVARDGSISPTFTKSTPAAGSRLPFGMAVIPGKNALVVADVLIGFDIFTFHGDSATSVAIPIPDQLATCWVTFSQKTGNFYLSDPSISALTEIHVDDNLNGTIVNQHVQRPGVSIFDTDVVTIAKQDFLYALSSQTLTIEVFIPASPGVLEHLQSFDFTAGAKGAGVTVNTQNVQGISATVRSGISGL